MPEPQRKAAFVQAGGGAHLAWLGERLRYLLVGEQTGGRCAIASFALSPSAASTPHIRRREHVGLFVLSGEMAVRAGSRSVHLSAGGLVVIPPGVPRQVLAASDAPASALLFEGPAGFDEFQFRTGYPLPREGAPMPEPEQEEPALLRSLAPSFGVELEFAPYEWATVPALHSLLPGEGPCFAVVGDLYRFLAVSADTGGRYALWHATVTAGGGPPWHSHAREDEAFYVLEGSVTFRVDGTAVTLGPGGLAHLPIGTRHRFTNDSDSTAEMLILVAPAGLERMFETVGRPATGGLPVPPGSDEIARLVEEAPKYGIEIFDGP